MSLGEFRDQAVCLIKDHCIILIWKMFPVMSEIEIHDDKSELFVPIALVSDVVYCLVWYNLDVRF